VIDLDDPSALSRADPAGMLQTTGRLASQCRAGYDLGRAIEPFSSSAPRAVVFCGMGGSGVAGEVVAAVFADLVAVPVVVVKGTELPGFCGPDTLVVASSYSGATAETLGAFDEAVERQCDVVAIASGGPLPDRADSRGITAVRLPAGFMPRAAFGLLVFAALGVVESAGLVPGLAGEISAATAALDGVITTLGPASPTRANEAKRVALEIGARMPVVWGEQGLAATAAGRWKTQMNENAKVPAMASALPELDHNEVVGWARGTGEAFAVVALRHEGERSDDAARFRPSLDIAADAGAHTTEVWARGESALSRFLSLVAIGDHASTYLAALRGVDPTPIEAIVRLKQALADA
jgi:glucose/mannose-6-phosphate isomerase